MPPNTESTQDHFQGPYSPFDLKADQNDNSAAEAQFNKTVQTEEKRSLCSKIFKNAGGCFMALSASFFFSTSFLIIKVLSNHGLQPFGSALLLNLGVLLPCCLLIVWNEFGPGYQERGRVLKGIWPLDGKTVIFCMLVQGLLQATSVILRSLALRHMSVGDMTVIVFSSPIVTTLLAHFLLKEECGLGFILIAVFTLCGVGLVTKPPILTGGHFDHELMIGSCFALTAMLALSMKFVVTRRIKETHFLAMTFFLGLAGALVSLPFFLVFESPASLIPESRTGLLLRLSLVTGFGAVASINLALKMEDAGVVALVRSFDVIFAFVFQYFVLGVVPDLLSGIGATMVWSGVILAGVRKFLLGKRKKQDKIAEKGFPDA